MAVNTEAVVVAPKSKRPVHIDTAQLRAAIFGKSTKAFAYYGIAQRLRYKDHWGIETFDVVRVYGKCTKTVAVSWKEGYTDKQNILCKVPGTEEGYQQALAAIKTYFSE